MTYKTNNESGRFIPIQRKSNRICLELGGFFFALILKTD